jgi:hypothetical protein
MYELRFSQFVCKSKLYFQLDNYYLIENLKIHEFYSLVFTNLCNNKPLRD